MFLFLVSIQVLMLTEPSTIIDFPGLPWNHGQSEKCWQNKIRRKTDKAGMFMYVLIEQYTPAVQIPHYYQKTERALRQAPSNKQLQQME